MLKKAILGILLLSSMAIAGYKIFSPHPSGNVTIRNNAPLQISWTPANNWYGEQEILIGNNEEIRRLKVASAPEGSFGVSIMSADYAGFSGIQVPPGQTVVRCIGVRNRRPYHMDVYYNTVTNQAIWVIPRGRTSPEHIIGFPVSIIEGHPRNTNTRPAGLVILPDYNIP